MPGETVIDVPVPSATPPHEPLYQCQSAAVPRLPPLTVKVAAAPEHTVPLEADMEDGFVLTEFIVITVDTQPVLPQMPSALK